MNEEAITIMLHRAASEVDPQRRRSLMAEVERARSGRAMGTATPGYVPPINEDGSPNPAAQVDLEEMTSSIVGSKPGVKTTTTSTKHVYPVSQRAMTERLEEFVAANAKLSASLQANANAIPASADQVAAATLDEGKARASAITAAGEIEATRQQGAVDIAKFFHATLGPEDALTKAEQQRQQSQTVMDMLKPSIDAADSIRLLDNPLEWLVNQLVVPQMKTQYNAALRTQQQQSQFIATTQKLTESQRALDLSVTGQQLRDKATAMAQAETFGAMVKATAVRNSALHQVSQITMQQAALQNMSMNAWEQYLRMTREALGMQEVAKADAALQPAVDKINMQKLYVGMPEITVAEFRMMNAEQRDFLARQASLPAGTIGANVGDSYRYLTRTGGLNTLAEKNPVTARTLATQWSSTDYKNFRDKMIQENPRMANMDPDEQEAKALEAYNNQEVKTLTKDRKYDKLPVESPRRLSIGTAVQYPDLANNSFLPAIKERLAAGGFQKEVTPEDLERVAAARAMNEPGKIKEIAKDLSDFYRTAQEQQWVKSGAAALGVGRPREFGSTTMTVNGKPVNQWNPVEIEQWLMQRVTRVSVEGFDVGRALGTTQATENFPSLKEMFTPKPDGSPPASQSPGGRFIPPR